MRVGWEAGIFLFSMSLNGLIQEFGLFWEFCEIRKMRDFWVPQLLFGDWLQIGHWVVRKTVLCIVCFAYSLLLLLLLVLVFLLLSY